MNKKMKQGHCCSGMEIYTPYFVVTSGKASQMHENLKNVLICILANNKVYTEHAVIFF